MLNAAIFGVFWKCLFFASNIKETMLKESVNSSVVAKLLKLISLQNLAIFEELSDNSSMTNS